MEGDTATIPDEGLPVASPFDRWREASSERLTLMASHAEAVCDTPAEVIEALVANGAREHGLRPARVLLSQGLLTHENLRSLLPPAPPTAAAPQEQNEGAVEATPASELADDTQQEAAETGHPLALEDVDGDIARMVAPETLHRLKMLPYKKDNEGRIIIAAAVRPESVPWQDQEEICDHLAVDASDVIFRHVNETQLFTCIEQIDSAAISQQFEPANEGAATRATARENYEQLVRLSKTDVGNRAGQAIRQLILQAAALNASDIHVVGERDDDGTQCYRARLRVDGDLQMFTDQEGKVVQWSPPVGEAITQRIASQGDLADDPQSFRDGRYDIQPTGLGIYDLRVSVAPTVDGYFLAIRLLGGHGHSAMEDIYPTDETDLVAQFKEVFADMRKGGLFLVAGATGSGKSTFLAAAARYLNRSEVNLVTIEHPVEHRIPGARQIQVDPDSETLSFNRAITAAMRLDPDIIIIGELRDVQTVEVAVQAAKTGHMVLSTIHVSDAASTPSRFRDLGVEPIEVARVLSGVLAQSLVRTLCSHCVQAGQPRERCAHCSGTGWRGRAAIGELLKMDRNIVELIRQDADPSDIADAANVRSKALNASALIAAGRTTKDAIAAELGVTAGEEAQAEYARRTEAGDGQ